MRHDSRTALLCHEYLHKTYASDRFDLSEVKEPDLVLEKYKELGRAHEIKVLEFLKSLQLRIEDLHSVTDWRDREIATARLLLSDEIDIILGASIGEICELEIARLRGTSGVGDFSRASKPDLLIRVGQDVLNQPLWAPVDIKSHSAYDSKNRSNSVKVTSWPNNDPVIGTQESGRISREDAFQLGHYLTHLRNLGLANVQGWAGIIGREYEECAWTMLDGVIYGTGANAETVISAYTKAFADAVQIIGIAQARNIDSSIEPPTIPQKFTGKFGCSTCDFIDVCEAEMNAYDGDSGHVTLLATVTPDKAVANLNGIQSISVLSTASGLNDFGSMAKIRSQVWLDHIPRLLDLNSAFDLPEFNIEIDIDLENSQEALQEIAEGEELGRDQVYLYGYGVLDREISQDWNDAEFDSISDYTNTEEGEMGVLLSMWQKLVSLADSAELLNKTLGIFHYSPHEKSWWRKFASRYENEQGVPSLEDINNFMDRYFIDLLPYVRKISFPTMDYSIKSLAPLAGFHWSAKDAGGAQSLLKYSLATSPSAATQAKAEAIEWLRSYNLDDVKATFAVREYLRSLNF